MTEDYTEMSSITAMEMILKEQRLAKLPIYEKWVNGRYEQISKEQYEREAFQLMKFRISESNLTESNNAE